MILTQSTGAARPCHTDSLAPIQRRTARVPNLYVLSAIAIVGLTFVCVASAQSATSVWDGVFTDEQVKRGQAAYQKECAGCHGSALEGGDMTPSLVGGAFTSNWNDLTLGDLFERIRLTMPLDAPGRLSRQQNADVIAYVLKTNEWPAGAAELPSDLGPLKQIKIQATK
jgi:mono/diheme cytochrome c family protein